MGDSSATTPGSRMAGVRRSDKPFVALTVAPSLSFSALLCSPFGLAVCASSAWLVPLLWGARREQRGSENVLESSAPRMLTRCGLDLSKFTLLSKLTKAVGIVAAVNLSYFGCRS